MWCLALTLLIYMVLGCCATMVDTTHTGMHPPPKPLGTALVYVAASKLLA